MKKFFSWIVMIPFAVVVIVFCAANRGLVDVNLWPLPFTIGLPLFSVVLSTFVFGFLFGGVVAWLSAGKTRREVWHQRSRADHAELELNQAQRKAKRAEEERRKAASVPATTDAA